MTKKTLLDTNELNRRTEDYVNRYLPGPLKMYYSDRAHWNAEQKDNWQRAKANVYAQMRAENKQKNKNFWLNTFNNGCIDEFLKKYGLRKYGNRVVFWDCGSFLFKQYLEAVVLPAFESELNIKGIKLKSKRITGLTQDLFDWEKAEIKEGGNNDKDSN